MVDRELLVELLKAIEGKMGRERLRTDRGGPGTPERFINVKDIRTALEWGEPVSDLRKVVP